MIEIFCKNGERMAITEKLAFIDHYDSFSYNVLDWLYRAGVNEDEVFFARCDDRNALDHARRLRIPLVFSPGPHQPKDVPLSLLLMKSAIDVVPILGICLGHQMLGFAAGAAIVPAKAPWHGATQPIEVLSHEGPFSGVEKTFRVACYNSLTVERASLRSIPGWTVLAQNNHHEIMAMKKDHAGVATWSVQFHPESFMSEHGNIIAANWLQQI